MLQALTAGAAGAVLVFACWRTQEFFDAKVAAWVQAVGTIAAVVGATWVANRQSAEAHERERKARTSAHQTRLDDRDADRAAALAIIDYCRETLREIVSSLKKLETRTMMSTFTEAEMIDTFNTRSLDHYPVELLRDAVATTTFLFMRRHVSLVRYTIRALLISSDQNDIDETLSSLDSNINQIDQAAKAFRRRCEDLRRIDSETP
jgi:hypothetical protein